MKLLPKSDRHVDVVVVGLGLSGLSAIRLLSGAGISIQGIDARARIGGKTQTIKSENGRSFEGGPEFVKPGHERMKSLMKEFGLKSTTLQRRGHKSVFRGGVRWTEHNDYIEPGIRCLRERFDQLKADFEKGALEDWVEGCSVGTWLGMHGVDTLHQDRFAQELVFELAGTDPFAVSMAAAVSYHASAGHSHNHQSARIVGGGSALATNLALGLEAHPVALDTIVHAVTRNYESVEIQTNNGVVTASFVVLAVSPTALKQIRFSPELPESRRRLISGWKQQASSKSFVVFERRWWVDAGLSGFAEGDTSNAVVMNASRDDEREGTLLLFANEAAGAPRFSQEAIKAGVLADLERYFQGLPYPVVDFATISWASDPFAGGCGSPLPSGYPVRSRLELARPIGNIFFAGTEVAEHGWGSMEGAVRAGEAAAEGILSIVRTDQRDSGLPSHS
ncbi:NAD(P)/FAD-dependent oxidoreductase (plasmid) [Rhizobium sp. 32-5/1]|uniref:flavin monoamine oxidase family protein n=1 Tax=Rhizobium sp. 32-5/1 TaxID=3019602 RepID=UPI00240D0D44|nr:NAD(P)/FAD-dependent oxidoreductase [Rhizobium sp. 32-5/1]WEZ85359.1 NAD(P)/FAD-dependent oxidoreductase [Rhizobium sp. 32-5/1]